MTKQLTSGIYAFDSRQKQPILHLADYQEPGYPTFLSVKLRKKGSSGTLNVAMWYVGKTMDDERGEVNRYHVQLPDAGSVLPALLYADDMCLEILAD